MSGIIDAPQANMVVSGNGNIYGAVIANAFIAKGNAGFHYDENLATNGPMTSYKLGWTRRAT